jgi:hypothetical protein
MVENIVKKDEENIHRALLSFMRLKFSDVIFRTDGAGLFMPKRTAINFAKNQSGKGYPDVFVAHPTGEYSGLMIEVKKDDNEVLLKNLKIRNNKHIQKQYSVLKQLNDRGYYAVFGCGIDNCMSIVDAYMENDTKVLNDYFVKYSLGFERLKRVS